jgi:tetratricopeptide (TPR) repeat protein
MVANACGIVLGASLWPLRPSRRTSIALALVALSLTASVAGASYWQLRHYNRGLLHERRGEFALALREYHLALGDGLESAALFNGLGWVEIESGVGSPARAVAFAARARALRPDDPDIADTYAWALHHAGRTREALPLLLEAYAASPTMYCIHYHLGEVYAALGEVDRARDHFARQIALLPGEREARRAEAALRRLERASVVAPDAAAAAPR